MKKGKVYAIITARGQSKGLPQKNIRLLAGKPLIAYTILAAIESKKVDRCIVSTEDPVITKISIEWGAEVIERPAKLADDLTPSFEVVKHVLKTLEKYDDMPEYFVLLQPTSPLRNALHLASCIDAFFKSDANSAISVTTFKPHPYKTFIVKNGELKPLFSRKYLHMPRQMLPQVLRQNGAIYMTESKIFLKKNTFFIPPVMPFFMSEQDSIDIDTEFDFIMAETIFLRNRGSE